MAPDHRAELANIKRFDQLVRYLRDRMGWPIDSDDFEEITFEYTPEELGIDTKNAAKIQEIKRLRPLSPNQPWGIFFVKFEPRKLPVVALRRILGQVALKKRASANKSERQAWAADDLLFVSNYGEGEERQISFAHFATATASSDLPTLKVLGWDNLDTALHLDAVARELNEHLGWPADDSDAIAWRAQWRAAFTIGHREVITTSRDLSVRLAELARGIRDRIKTALAIETDQGQLTKLLKAFQGALVHDLDADGFADMYAQTIAYGLLSARIADPHKKTADDFAAHMRTNPFLRELMETFLKVGGRRSKAGGAGIDFDELGVSDVVTLLDDANMEAVVLDFGDRNPQEDPVIHFYELFLKEYDAKRRMQRGVFYTPRPIVSYIVRSIDELLRKEFGLADGLADTATWADVAKDRRDLEIPVGVDASQDFVQILDPATGTGTFLVEVIDHIHRTLCEKWSAAGHGSKKIEELWNSYVPKHLLPRLHGYELLMAPYAIAHLKIGLKLFETGYHFASDERARIYLTNALEPAHDFSGRFEFSIPALAHEAAAVNAIKRDRRFTVVLGNPPYSKASQNQGEWVDSLMEEYKRTVRQAETQIQALSDDYAKFVRFGHFMLEQSQAGILGFITNNGYLDGPLFRDMRSSLLAYFEKVRILNLHGDSRKQFAPPEGMADENVFDIQQGVAVTHFCRSHSGVGKPDVGYRNLWGTREERYSALQGSCASGGNWESLEPAPPLFLFIPVEKELEAEFRSGWHLYDVFGTGNREVDNHESYGAGFVTQQDAFAIGMAPDDVARNVERFLEPRAKEDALWDEFDFCSTNQWNFKRAKKELRSVDVRKQTRRCLYRPFDYRYTVFDRNICTIIRSRITSQFDRDNVALLATRRVTRLPFNNVFATDIYAEYKVASHDRNTIVFPLWIEASDEDGPGLFVGTRRVNLSPKFLTAVAECLGVVQEGPHQLPRGMTAEAVLGYVYGVLHSPGYRSRYGEFLKMDFPCIPLPRSPELLRTLSEMGSELLSLHLMKSPKLKLVSAKYLGDRNPKVERAKWSDDTVWLDSGGGSGFQGVSEAVWEFNIGGYQVCDKWLKSRKGQTLSRDDISHYLKIVTAVGHTIELMRNIEESIVEQGGWPSAFQARNTASAEDVGPVLMAAEDMDVDA